MSKEIVCGAVSSGVDVRDYTAHTEKTEFPSDFTLNLPKVKNQGTVGSCVAHALSTVIEYFNQRETGKYEEMSTGYIYGNRRYSTYKGVGMKSRDAINTATKYGDVPYSHFPVNVEVPYAIEKFESEVDKIEQDGYHFKFAEYFRLRDDNAIKTSLMENGPVVFSIYMYDDIKIVDGVMQTNLVKTKKTPRHCMVMYGWNETGWKIQNSWGRLWGKRGRAVIPYGFPFLEVWGIRDAETGSNLILQKPFKTKFGAAMAKILNSVISFVYNMFHKTDK
jgi:C1A family cysteine protease